MASEGINNNQSSNSTSFTDINYDLEDETFKQLQEDFFSEIKKSFECSDYDKLVEYILKAVFQEKKSKEMMIEESKEMFKDKTEYIIDYLWQKTISLYNLGDLVDEITSKNVSSVKKVASEDKERVRERSRSRDEDEEDNNNNNSKKNSQYPYRGRGGPRRFMPKRGFMYPPPMMMPPRGRMFPIPSRGIFRGGKRGGPTRPPAESGTENGNPEQDSKNDQNENKEINNDMQESNPNTNSTENKKDVDTEKTEGGESQGQTKKKIRCKNWPQCKDANCEYTHPTETCPYFPTCKYGTKCMYIHPNVSCKYGYYCTRIGCNYSHPAGWNPGVGVFPMPYMGPPGRGRHPKKNNPSNEVEQK